MHYHQLLTLDFLRLIVNMNIWPKHQNCQSCTAWDLLVQREILDSKGSHLVQHRILSSTGSCAPRDLAGSHLWSRAVQDWQFECLVQMFTLIISLRKSILSIWWWWILQGIICGILTFASLWWGVWKTSPPRALSIVFQSCPLGKLRSSIASL